jgi:hypothetical protein
MAGSPTRKRDETPVEPEPQDGPAVSMGVDFDERVLGETETEAERAAAAAANDGAEAEFSLAVDDDPVISPGLNDDLPADPFEDDYPEPVTTNVTLRLGRRFGVRKVKLVHAAGCPGHTNRVETYPKETPSGRKGIVTRCCDCAQQAYTRLT